MTKLCVIFRVFFSLLLIDRCSGISSSVSPFTNYQHSAELELNVADLWWTVNEIEKEIIFELHVNTTGWIALGISPGIFLFEHTLISRLRQFLKCSWWNERRRYWCRMGRPEG